MKYPIYEMSVHKKYLSMICHIYEMFFYEISIYEMSQRPTVQCAQTNFKLCSKTICFNNIKCTYRLSVVFIFHIQMGPTFLKLKYGR